MIVKFVFQIYFVFFLNYAKGEIDINIAYQNPY